MTKKILGIDPGTGRLGFGVIEKKNSSLMMVDAGVITTDKSLSDSQRLKIIFDDITEIIAKTKPDYISIEKLFFAQNVTTAMTVSQARGVVLLLAEQNNLPIYEYTPLQIKQALTGYGRADKKQIQNIVKLILNLKEIPKPDDCADALAAAIICAKTENLIDKF